MRSSTWTTLAALGALTVPTAADASGLQHQSADDVFRGDSLPPASAFLGPYHSQDPRSQGEPNEVERMVNDLKKRLAVSEANQLANQQEVGALRLTEVAFNRTMKLGSPMTREAALRYTVDARLTSVEAEMKQVVSPDVNRLYKATIDGIFSDVVVGRDGKKLDEFLRSELPELTATDRAEWVKRFGEEMARWRDFLKRDEAIQRLHASTQGAAVAVVPGIPAAARDFLASPSPDQATVLASVSSEYVTAKSLVLERLLSDHRQREARR